MHKNLKTRIQNKHDTETNWINAVNFVPLAGEVIIYDTDATHDVARVKIGDGKTKVNDLNFVTTEVPDNFETKSDAADKLAESKKYTDDRLDDFVSCGTVDPSAEVTSQFYFKYASN